mmetsp:Transcript_87119/g.259900  ORF Transcript_87119/g.259900 Transcript_87119/m.259900 type:complete len:170 (-) Transcript_87119:141-650(-)
MTMQPLQQVPDHARWQERVQKEDVTVAGQLMGFQGPRGMHLVPEGGDPYDTDTVAPLHDLHRTISAPTVLPRIASASSARGSLPRTGHSLGRSGTALTAASSRYARSHRSASSSASVRQHIRDSVKEEITRSLQGETIRLPAAPREFPTKRDRLEAMLRQARGEALCAT